MDSNSLFYYSADGRRSYRSRYDALRHPGPCQLYFHDREFLALDWTHEPSPSLADLYRARAEQIRRDYDYVILAYSGGHDSSNVFETFHYNGIPVDEILTVGALSRDRHTGSDENHNGELYHQVFPTLERLKPCARITVADYAPHFAKPQSLPLLAQHGPEFYKHVGSMFSANHIFWRDLRSFIGDRGGKRVALVLGTDKPAFFWDAERGAGYTQFTDIGLADYGGRAVDENFERVNFYTSLEGVDIIRKQLHIIQAFYREHVLEKGMLSGADFSRHYAKIIHRLIYRLRNPLVFESKKSPSSLVSPRDTFLFREKSSDMFKLFREGVYRMREEIPHVVRAAIERRHSMFMTRRYYLA